MIQQTTFSETLQIILIGFAILLFIFFQFGFLNLNSATVSINETVVTIPDEGDDGQEFQMVLNHSSGSSPFSQNR